MSEGAGESLGILPSPPASSTLKLRPPHTFPLSIQYFAMLQHINTAFMFEDHWSSFRPFILHLTLKSSMYPEITSKDIFNTCLPEQMEEVKTTYTCNTSQNLDKYVRKGQIHFKDSRSRKAQCSERSTGGHPFSMYIYKQDGRDNEYGSEGGVVWLNGFQSLETLFQVVSREPRL